jgi:hypothetical protein
MSSTSIFSLLPPNLSPAGKTDLTKTLTTTLTLLRVESRITTFQGTTRTSCAHRRSTLTAAWKMCTSRMQWRRHCKGTRKSSSARRGKETDIDRINRRHIRMMCSTSKIKRRRSGETGRIQTCSLRFRWKSARLARSRRPRN